MTLRAIEVSSDPRTHSTTNPRVASDADIVLRAPVNWTWVIFFLCLGAMHLFIATSTFLRNNWAGYLSLILGTIFCGVSILCYRIRSTITIHRKHKRIRLISHIGPVTLRRDIPFCDVHGVRLTLSRRPDYPTSRIELLCDNEEIDCPPAQVPRQDALCLAMLLGCRLIKVDNGAE